MIKSMCSERFIEVDGNDHNAALTIHGVSDASSVFLDHQGVTALIKELEEVREKLPKPKVKVTWWANLYRTGAPITHPTKESADFHATEERVECREITWEVDDE